MTVGFTSSFKTPSSVLIIQKILRGVFFFSEAQIHVRFSYFNLNFEATTASRNAQYEQHNTPEKLGIEISVAVLR
jgi:hypothetical protein